jgi:hypothetical protein
MSKELKKHLDTVLEEDYKRLENTVEEELPRYISLLLDIAKYKKLDVTIWFEGTKQSELNKQEKELNMLERANLIKGKMKYTHRNVYREYELTKKGAELVEELSKRD